MRRPSAATASSCRIPSAARRRRTDSRGSIPRRPSRPGCGTASSSGASASRPGSSPEIRSGSRRRRARRRAHAAQARGNARCTVSPATRCCRCRSPDDRRTGRAECPGSSSTSGGRARRDRGCRTTRSSGACEACRMTFCSSRILNYVGRRGAGIAPRASSGERRSPGRTGGRARDRRRARSCPPDSPPAGHACAGSPALRRPGSEARFPLPSARRR